MLSIFYTSFGTFFFSENVVGKRSDVKDGFVKVFIMEWEQSTKVLIVIK